jgi:hypothetical protein
MSTVRSNIYTSGCSSLVDGVIIPFAHPAPVAAIISNESPQPTRIPRNLDNQRFITILPASARH